MENEQKAQMYNQLMYEYTRIQNRISSIKGESINLNQQQLNEFNSQEDITIINLPILKIDGSLLTLSNNLPTPFISPEMNFVREDYCAQQFFQIKGIPQYLISNRIKGHNYNHYLKRTNTTSTRNDLDFKIMEEKNIKAMNKFLHEL